MPVAAAPVAAPLVAAALASGSGSGSRRGAAAFPSLRPRITKMPRATSAMTTTTNSSRCLPGESSMAGSATGADGGTATRTAVRAPASTASVPAASTPSASPWAASPRLPRGGRRRPGLAAWARRASGRWCGPAAARGRASRRRPRRRLWPSPPNRRSRSAGRRWSAAAAAARCGRCRPRRPATAGRRSGCRPSARGHPVRGGRADAALGGAGPGPVGDSRAIGRGAARPPGRAGRGRAGHDGARRGGGHPAEPEGRLAPRDLGPLVGAEHAVADRGEQVLERLPVDEHRHRDQRDHHDLERPGQLLIGGAHDQRVAVEQDRQDERDRDLFQQHADEHLEPADRDHPAEPGMHPDDQEERPGDEQQQEAELQDDQGQRDQQHQQPGRDGGEQRGEPDLQPGRPLIALEQRVHRGVLGLQAHGDAVVDGLLLLGQRGRGRLVGRDRLGEEQGPAVLVHHVGVGGGRAERCVLRWCRTRRPARACRPGPTRARWRSGPPDRCRR